MLVSLFARNLRACRLVVFLLSSLLVLVLAGCGSASSDGSHITPSSSSSQANSSAASSSAPGGAQRISIPFAAYAGTTAIACGVVLDGLGIANSSGSIADFRFYVHNLRLVTSTGEELAIVLDESELQTDNIALLDFRDKLATPSPCAGEANPYRNTQVVGEVNVGNHTIAALRFVLGVPASHNHANQAIAKGPLQSPGLASGMNWSWNIGYKFTGLDLLTATPIARPDGATANRFNIHVGSTGCTGDATLGETVSCSAQNRGEFTLPLAGRALNAFAVKFDYAALVAESDLSQDYSGTAGCMSAAGDTECAALFAALGMAHATQTAAPAAQRVFSVVDATGSFVADGFATGSFAKDGL